MAATKRKTTAQKSDGGQKKAATRKRKTKVEPASVGLRADECATEETPRALLQLSEQIAACGGSLLASYREPLGGHWVAFAALPLERVEPTPYQRELSKAHSEKLVAVIPKVGRFLDPIVCVRDDEHDRFITPNGMHRLSAMRALGAKAITALIVPEHEVAFRILALNTEKAHNLRDKALEVVRMLRALAEDAAPGGKRETDYQLEFEHPALMTLGVCYERNGRFSGGAYYPVVSRCEEFADRKLTDALALREQRADQLIELDGRVNEAVKKLKESGFQSGYLKPVVVARINPLRFVRSKPGEEKRPDFDKTLARMISAAEKFDAGKVKTSDFALAAAMGSSEEG